MKCEGEPLDVRRASLSYSDRQTSFGEGGSRDLARARQRTQSHAYAKFSSRKARKPKQVRTASTGILASPCPSEGRQVKVELVGVYAAEGHRSLWCRSTIRLADDDGGSCVTVYSSFFATMFDFLKFLLGYYCVIRPENSFNRHVLATNQFLESLPSVQASGGRGETI